MLITSLNNDRVKELVKLKDKKYRDNNNLFFVEGYDIALEAYKNNIIKELYVLEGTDVNMDIPVTYVSYDVMKKISDMESISEYYAVCYKRDENNIGNRIIVLDNIQDPGNLGTIIRSSVAFNFDTVVLSKNTVDLYNPKVIRSTKGMLFNQNVLIRDIELFLSELDGYTVYGTDVSNGNNIKEEDIPSKIVLVIGNEGRGISDNIKKLCDKFIYISMNSECESLNASVAASILMYEVNNK
ncbi:MAG: RNA methyltransferase [Bacilli bacterium]|nr:RNA methyltransferase [Bacilli bacterium]